MTQATIALVGNPNCGKTTLFNALTGAHQRVGNWPGVTVERKEGNYRYQGQIITVVDLPGVYSVDAEDTTTGLDELVARDYLLSGEADVIINIVDASNLERNLYLTTQILEMGVPMMIALNMMDLAEKREIRIDPHLLSERLGCPVVPLCAHKGTGVSQLKDLIQQALMHPAIPQTYVAYSPVIEDALADLIPVLQTSAIANPAQMRWFALNLLEYDDRHLPNLGQDTLRQIAKHRHRIHQTLGEDTDLCDCRQPLYLDSEHPSGRCRTNSCVEANSIRSHRSGNAQSVAGNSHFSSGDVSHVSGCHQFGRCVY
jgi:ferrous iron transport protein B